MIRKSTAISRTSAIAIVIVLLIATVGGFYLYTSGGGATTSSTTSTTSSTGVTTTSHSTTSTTTQSTTSAVAQPQFVKDNTLVYETAGNFQWLDPSVSYYQADFGIFQNVFDKLVWLNGDNSTAVIPWLAKDYSSSNGGKTWTFHLNTGIKFADGTPFNATAVWFSFNRLLILDGTAGDQSVHGSQAAWIIQQLLNTSLSSNLGPSQSYSPAWVQQVLAENFVQVIDTNTVQINVQHPSASFLYLLANEWADILSPSWVVAHDDASLMKPHMTTADYVPYWNEFAGLAKLTAMILPATAVMAGSGPYYIASVDPTTFNVVLKINPNYWGGPAGGFTVAGKQVSLGAAKIPTIYINYVADTNTRLLDLKAGKATMIDTAAADIYSVADRTSWLSQGKLVSIVPGANIHGTYPTLITDWFEFGSNITTAGGTFRTFQPFADWRLREAVRVSVNLTDLNINVANRLDATANTLVPPGTAPTGSYDEALPVVQFNLTKARALLNDVQANPLTSATSVMHYYNGTVIPAGVVDNSFDKTHPQIVVLVYVAGGTTGQAIISQIATNLNQITTPRHCVPKCLGITFVTEPLGSSQRYSQMANHHIDFAPAGWVLDYNWVTDWIGPMFSAAGTYFSWSLWNNTALQSLVNQVFAADNAGNTAQLVSLSRQAQALENQAAYYMWNNYPLAYYPTSTWLTGFYYNEAIGDSGFYFPTYSYAAPS